MQKYVFKKGFTLIELLVVISIVSLLSSVVLSALNNARGKAKLSAGKQQNAAIFNAVGDKAMDSWDFDSCSGTAVADKSGQSNTLSLFNISGSWPTDTPLGRGCSLSFNGSSQYGTAPRNISDDFTITFWMKTTQNISGGTQWYNGRGLVDAEVGGVTDDFGVSFGNNKIYFGIGNPDTTIASRSNVNTGDWIFVAATRVRSTGKINLYINGALENSGVGNTNSLAVPSLIYVGVDPTGGGWFNGSIDDINIYSTSFTAEAVRRAYAEQSQIYFAFQ